MGRFGMMENHGQETPSRFPRKATGDAAGAKNDQPRPPPPSSADAAGQFLAIIRDLALELRPERKRSLRVRLDSELDRDLGFDSLARAELLFRIERAFKITLPEDLIGEAASPRDLLGAIAEAARRETKAAAATIQVAALEPLDAEPFDARTLIEVIEWHRNAHPDRPHIVLVGAGGAETTITYGGLDAEARRVAGGLRQFGLGAGERVAIMLPTCADFFSAFIGALYAGGVPTPIYPPLRTSRLEDHLRRQASILKNAEAAVLIATPAAHAVAALLGSLVPSLKAIIDIDALRNRGAEGLPAAPDEGKTAFLQYTSGSTGDPKGVIITHANLLANIRAMGEAMNASSSDVFVSWLPLYHDMGLIGAWLGSLYFGALAVLMSPQTFLVRPDHWLWAMHRRRATLSAAPNFAFELCVRKIDDAMIEGLDLGSLRMVANGSEPVGADTIRRFYARFGRYGFREGAMAPVYGLAENAVGLAFPPPGRPPIVDRVEREPLVRWGEAKAARPDDATALEFVGCGRPIPGHQIRVIDETGREAGERREGRVQFRGPSATQGYFRNEPKTRALFDGDWLETGDLGYIGSGEIFITGRSKDIIIRAGRHIYPEEVERAIGEIAGVRKGCVVVFGGADRASGTERVVVVAETRQTSDAEKARLRDRIGLVAAALLDAPPDQVVLAPPYAVPKTSSGKLRRAAARDLYESGQLGAAPTAVWWQVTRVILGAVTPQIQRRLHTLLEFLYAGYWWIVMSILIAATWPFVVLSPRRCWRWAMVQKASRLALKLTGTPLQVEGLENLPREGGGVLVANHSSYLDSLALSAAIPGDKAFVAKRELLDKFFARLALKALGAVFVERWEPGAGLEDARRLTEVARTGRRLVYFPEAGFGRTPGLLAFRLGAFTTAIEAGVPVYPVTIRGARSILRGGQWFPRRGSLNVRINKAITGDGDDFTAAVRIRDAARSIILQQCGEPDLPSERVSMEPTQSAGAGPSR